MTARIINTEEARCGGTFTLRNLDIRAAEILLSLVIPTALG